MLRQPNGINISEYVSGEVDFRALRSTGISFMYHTTTTGDSHKDRLYLQRKEEASLEGVAFGALHQARPTKRMKSADTQASHFVECAKFEPGDLIPAVAIYETSGITVTTRERWLKRFSSRVQALTGHAPMILSPLDFPEALEGLRWVPQHTTSAPPPEGHRAALWQHSGRVSGVDDIVCVNTFLGSTGLRTLKTTKSNTILDILHRCDEASFDANYAVQIFLSSISS